MKQRVPRILLVEDDPVSQAYLAAVLAGVPARVEVAACAQAAVQAVDAAGAHGAHVLWLVDAHLPDADGAELLSRLRPLAPWTPALAHTACSEPGAVEALLAAGFDRVLCKPVAASVLRAAARAALQPAMRVADAWDDGKALAALRNDHGDMEALRRMFRAELPMQHDALVAALKTGEMAVAEGILHRLRASCGFVGAVKLEAAVRRLQHAPCSAAALRAFNLAVAALLRRA